MDFFKHSKPKVRSGKTSISMPELHLGGIRGRQSKRQSKLHQRSNWSFHGAKSNMQTKLDSKKQTWHGTQTNSSDSDEAEVEDELDDDSRKEIDVGAKQFGTIMEEEPKQLTQERRVKTEMADLSYEELQQLKEKIGTKLYNEAMFSVPQERNAKLLKRANKNRPREESSKVPVSPFREIFSVKRKAKRDPRFDELSGPFNDRIHQQTYSFIKDIKAKEKEELRKALGEEYDQETRQKMKQLLNRMENQEHAEKLKAIRHQRAEQQKKAAVDKLREGKRPFFIKKSEMKKQELADKFIQLKKSGKLEKYLQKKRKKNAARDRRHLPV